jgi:ribosomal protein L7/L12
MSECRHCHQQVTEPADRCPNCGAWLADAGWMADPQFEQTVRTLMQAGQVIEAIKVYREQTGATLVEAKGAVEAIARQASPVTPPVRREDLTEPEARILELLQAGEKIAAIKVHREHFGSTLRDAKEAVEALAAQQGIAVPARSAGCLGSLLMLTIVLLGIASRFFG